LKEKKKQGEMTNCFWGVGGKGGRVKRKRSEMVSAHPAMVEGKNTCARSEKQRRREKERQRVIIAMVVGKSSMGGLHQHLCVSGGKGGNLPPQIGEGEKKGLYGDLSVGEKKRGGVHFRSILRGR